MDTQITIGQIKRDISDWLTASPMQATHYSVSRKPKAALISMVIMNYCSRAENRDRPS